MRIRILFLLIATLLSISSGYSCEVNQEEAFDTELKGRINSALECYKKTIQPQSKVNSGIFAEAYSQAQVVLKENMSSVKTLLESVSKATLTPNVESPQEEREISNALLSESLWNLLSSTKTSDFGSGIRPRKVAKIRKNFGSVRETIKVFEDTLSYVSAIFRGNFSTYSPEIYTKASQVYIGLLQWRENSCKTLEHTNLNLFNTPEFIKGLLESISKTGQINLLQFVCPPVDFSLLSSSTPENYFLVSPEGSLLSRHISHLSNLIKYLTPTGVHVKISFIVGDNDEENYIWPVLRKPVRLNEKKLSKRRLELILNIQQYVSKRLPTSEIAVHSLYLSGLKNLPKKGYDKEDYHIQVYQKILNHCENYFTPQEINTEMNRMGQLWLPGGYYSGLQRPDNPEILKEIVIAKFAAYAVDGLIARDCAPHSLLVQTEFPRKQRTKMMNLGRVLLENGGFSVIYLLGDREQDKLIFSPIQAKFSTPSFFHSTIEAKFV